MVLRVSGRRLELLDPRPRDCFAIPAPIVTRGDELCSGYGTTPEATPRITIGSTSIWECSFVIAALTLNVLWQCAHWSSASSSRLPMFAHVTSFRLSGCLHSLQRLGTSYGEIAMNLSSSSSASIHSTI